MYVICVSEITSNKLVVWDFIEAYLGLKLTLIVVTRRVCLNYTMFFFLLYVTCMYEAAKYLLSTQIFYKSIEKVKMLVPHFFSLRIMCSIFL